MFCPRCGKHGAVSGAIEGGTMYSCGFCTNQWVEPTVVEEYAAKVAATADKVAENVSPAKAHQDTIAEVEAIYTRVMEEAEFHRMAEQEAARNIQANSAHQHYGSQLVLFQMADRIKARLKFLKGEV